MRILALDWGEVRIGAAISDEEERIAFPLDQTLSGLDEIKKIVTELQIKKILVGNPKSLSGAESSSSKKVSEFLEKLKNLNIPIELLDERFSTVAATKILQAQGLPEKKQRLIKDNIAAQQMLQQYLDTKK